MVTITEPTEGDFLEAYEGVRPADMSEWVGGTGVRFFDYGLATINEAIKQGHYSRVAKINGKPMLVWGCDKDGNVWMFATEDAEKHSLSLHRAALPELDYMVKHYGPLVAVADERNTKHHVWLHWLGFTHVKNIIQGPFRLPFRYYLLERRT